MYEAYELEGRARRTIEARKLWYAILESQMETGTPYMLYKDACNRKSNQKNLGVIRCSNLCAENVEYTASDEVAVCNLASIALNKFVIPSLNGVGPRFDHEGLRKVTNMVTKSLNKVIDINYYPVEEARRSNLRHRPIGIGVQGLADAFLLMRFPFESAEARKLNMDIFETLYFSAVEASCEIAEAEGKYETYEGSPMSQGLFQYDLWQKKQTSGRWDWEKLREKVLKYGTRNSLLVAPMPTASSSQILGNNECFEPYTSNLYTRRVLSGEFLILNKHLIKDLQQLGLWSVDMKNRLVAANGSVQDMTEIPKEIRALYKTAWEIRQRRILEMAADRAIFIDHSQSLNVYIASPSIGKLTSMHFFGWKSGLKTGMYYLRTHAATEAIKFTLAPDMIVGSPHRPSLMRPLKTRSRPGGEGGICQNKLRSNDETEEHCLSCDS